MKNKKFFNGMILLFSIAASVFILASIFSGNSVIDIPMHDVYFVIANTQLCLFTAWVLIFFAFIYFLLLSLGKPLNKTLGIIHAVGTIIPFILIYLPVHIPVYRHYSFDNTELLRQFNFYTLILIGALLFVAVQLLFLVNIMITILNRKKT